MKIIKPALAKGTRDFNAQQVAKRNYIRDVIVQTYELFGFEPLETPAMERLSTLTGKYGAEGDRLLFKILNSGNWLKSADDQLLNKKDSNALIHQVSEKGLRYDLTVPFARYVVMNYHNIPMPYRRYQIQPVWRADRPQKGRYREFWQCDADVIGSNSLINEAEFVKIYDQVFYRLKIDAIVRINNRKILNGITSALGVHDLFTPIVTVIDKLDKIGINGVTAELEIIGLSPDQLYSLRQILEFKGSNFEKLDYLTAVFNKSENPGSGPDGIAEMREMLAFLNTEELKQITLELDLTLARGLSYYTGTIFEVVDRNIAIGSISGGGRYDDLTGIFGLPNVSGVGISFGMERIYDILEQTGWPVDLAHACSVIALIPLDQDAVPFTLQVSDALRNEGISTELYPDAGAKMKKKMKFVDARNIPFAGLIGSTEVSSSKVSVKNMATGEQTLETVEALIHKLNSK